tara:strand:+ start:446 stop:1153 length:708 start_codon:yes stop_codon:yes gene_type:complete
METFIKGKWVLIIKMNGETLGKAAMVGVGVVSIGSVSGCVDLEGMVEKPDEVVIETESRRENDIQVRLDPGKVDSRDSLYRLMFEAGTYENLGSDRNMLASSVENVDEVMRQYRERAFDTRIRVCERVLDEAVNNSSNFQYNSDYLGQSFLQAVQGLLGTTVADYQRNGLGEGALMDEGRLRRLEAVYNRAQEVAGDYVTGDNIGYHGIIGTLKDGRLVTVPGSTSMKDLIDVVR